MRPRLTILGILAIILLTCAAYYPVVHSGFIWDDDAHVTNNPPLRTTQGLSDIWAWGPKAVFNPKTLPGTQQYYPMTFTSFWLEYHAWALNPVGYHITNVCLHILSALLLWRILLLLGFSPGLSFFAAALFALHPIQVESVAWISERKNTLSLFLGLTAALCWLHWSRLDNRQPLTTHSIPPADTSPRSILWLLACLLLFILAIFAKTVISTLPALLLITYWLKRGRLSKTAILGSLPLFLISACLGSFTSYVEHYYIGARGGEFNLTWAKSFLIAGRDIPFYLSLLVAPFKLLPVYEHWNIDPHSLFQWLFPIGVALTLIILFLLRKKTGRGPLAAALFFIAALMPALGFVSFYPMRFSFVADHFAYVSTLGMLTFSAALLAALFSRTPLLAKSLAALLLLTLTVLTFRQTTIYKDEMSFYQFALDGNPDAFIAAENIAHHLIAKDGFSAFPRAIDLYHHVLETHPAESTASSSLSTVLLTSGDFKQAEAVLEKALSFDPENPTLHNYLGNALFLQKKYEQAYIHYDIAAANSPKDPSIFFNWGNTLLDAGNPLEAENKFRHALSLEKSPSAKTTFYLGLALRDQNRLGSARQAFADAIKIDPNMHDAFFELGNLDVRLHHDQLAHDEFLLSLKAAPNDIPTNLALARLARTSTDLKVADPLEGIERLQRVVDATHEQNIPCLLELAEALANSKFFEQAGDAMDKAIVLARAQGVPAPDLEMMLTKAQAYRVNDAPVINAKVSPLSIDNTPFDKDLQEDQDKSTPPKIQLAPVPLR